MCVIDRIGHQHSFSDAQVAMAPADFDLGADLELVIESNIVTSLNSGRNDPRNT